MVGGFGFQVDVWGDKTRQLCARRNNEKTEARHVFTRSLVRNARLDWILDLLLDGFLSETTVGGPVIWQGWECFGSILF